MRFTRSLGAVVLGAAVLASAGCGAHIPTDPDGTLDRVRGDELRVGVSPNAGFVEVDGDVPSGTEVRAIEAFADSLEADVSWTVGSEEALVRGLEDDRLDLVAGGITDDTPWVDRAGMSRPYADVTDADGRTRHLVMLVPLGENAFLSELETFLGTYIEEEGLR
ncbi:hypothetical protein [Microbacterium sp. GXF7504]